MVVKILWLCWFQGEEHLKKKGPKLNEFAFQIWRKLNPDWDIRVVDDKNVTKYVPEFQTIRCLQKRSFAAQSDLLRLYLLNKYGGVWADSSLVPTISLNTIVSKTMNETGFFTYRFMPRSIGMNGNRETVSWFLVVDKPEHYLIKTLLKKFKASYLMLKWDKYFQFHHDLCELYDSDKQIRYIIENMVQISEEIPHSIPKNDFDKIFTYSFLYKRPNYLISSNLTEKFITRCDKNDVI